MCWKEGLRDDSKFAWKHSNGATHVWSVDALNYLASLTDQQYDDVRAEYRAHMKSRG